MTEDKRNRVLTALSHVPRVQTALLPTPLERLHRCEEKLDYKGIYIKRDDLTGYGPGGNKLRSLEFIVGEALQEGADTLIASGPVQSNLCTLAAATAAKMGMHCILVHNGEKPEKLVGNPLLNELLGAESIFLGNVDCNERTKVVEETYRRLEETNHPYIIKNGATTGAGAFGYTNMICELEQQFQTLPRYHEQPTVFAPGGNGGVAAGLIYGNALCGFPFRIVIISVEDTKEVLTEHITRTIQDADAILHMGFPFTVDQVATIDDSYRGNGWGMNTKDSSDEVLSFPKLTGIFVENVYTSKVLVGMKDYIMKGQVKGPAIYVHTGGFGSLFAQY